MYRLRRMANRVLANNWGETRQQLVALVTAVVTRTEAARHSRRGMVCLPRKLSVAAVTMMVQGMPNRDKQHVESCQGGGSRSDKSDVQKTPWFRRVSESQVPCTTQVPLYHPGLAKLAELQLGSKRSTGRRKQEFQPVTGQALRRYQRPRFLGQQREF